MLLPIYLLGQKVLREEVKDVTPDYPGFKELYENMFETLKQAEGVGLACPQVGVSLKMFIVDLTPMSESKDDKYANYRKVFVNPEILEFSKDKISMEEGCLSIPDISESVSRSKSVKISYQDENFEKHVEEFSGYEARVIQHEYDHLLGTVFTDKISPIRKQLIKSKLKNIIKRKYVPYYKYC